MTRTRTVVVALVAASLGLILWDLRASDAGVRSAAQAATAPLQRTVTAVFAPFGTWARHVEDFGDPKVRAAQAAEISAPAGWATVSGRVVAADIAGDRAIVTIDVGADDGVRKGNAVLAVGGLVGKVRASSPHAATVALVTDPGSEIGVRILPSKEIGVSRGQGMDVDLRVDFLSPAASAAIGDGLVTLGSTTPNGIPPDLPIGTVTALDTIAAPSGRVVTARPVAGMTSLETLLVLTEKR